MWALRERTRISYGRALLAFANWLSLSWTVALGCVQGLLRKEGVFLRTPKTDEGLRVLAAVSAARTEIFLTALLWALDGALAATTSATPLLLALVAGQGSVYVSAPFMSWLDEHGQLSPDLERRRRTERRRELLAGIARPVAFGTLGSALAVGVAALVLVAFGASHPGAPSNPFNAPRSSPANPGPYGLTGSSTTSPTTPPRRPRRPPPRRHRPRRTRRRPRPPHVHRPRRRRPPRRARAPPPPPRHPADGLRRGPGRAGRPPAGADGSWRPSPHCVSVNPRRGTNLRGGKVVLVDRPLRSSAQRLRSFGLGVPISGGENTIGRSIKAFKPARGQVRAARRFAQASMALWGLETSAVVAVVDELAQNAVVHARSRFVVTLRRTGASVRVEVRDQDPRLPYLGTTHLLANSGRGLVVVEQLSLSWGAQPAPGGGKTVWAEVQVVPDPSPRPALAIGGHKSRPDWWDHLVIPHQVGAPGSAALIGEGPSASVG